MQPTMGSMKPIQYENTQELKAALRNNQVQGNFFKKLCSIAFGTGVVINFGKETFVVDRSKFIEQGVKDSRGMKSFVEQCLKKIPAQKGATPEEKAEIAKQIIKGVSQLEGTVASIKDCFQALKGAGVDKAMLGILEANFLKGKTDSARVVIGGKDFKELQKAALSINQGRLDSSHRADFVAAATGAPDLMPLPAGDVVVTGLGKSGLEKVEVDLPPRFDENAKEMYKLLTEKAPLASISIDAKTTFGVLGLIVMDRRRGADVPFMNAINKIKSLPEEQRKQFLAAASNSGLAQKLDAPIRAETPPSPGSTKFLGDLTIEAHLIAIRNELQ